jgi:hypothetical protein
MSESGGSDSEVPEAPADAQLPATDFSTLILSFSHSARVHLGDAPSPLGETAAVNLELARQSIELLALLQEKTRGNLTGQEERLLDQALYELRLRFVEVAERHRP